MHEKSVCATETFGEKEVCFPLANFICLLVSQVAAAGGKHFVPPAQESSITITALPCDLIFALPVAIIPSLSLTLYTVHLYHVPELLGLIEVKACV